MTVLAPWTSAGIPVVGLEPSCTAVFRADAADLFPGTATSSGCGRRRRPSASCILERAADWDPPRLDRDAIVQMHCHQHAVLDEHADVELLRRAGVSAQVLDSGCCGLAGNFGFEAGHYDVSMQCAEDGLLPALRAASDGHRRRGGRVQLPDPDRAER